MKRWWALLGGVLAAAFAAYLPCLDGAFLLDDVRTIRDPLVVDPFGQRLGAWLSSSRPVVTLTFAANHLAVGLDPRGWHLTNVAIHLAAAALAWRFARVTLTRAGLAAPEGPALAAAALFALHPLQTESVAYVTQRAESLASAVYLAALLLLLAGDVARTRGRRLAFLAAAAGLQAVGLGVKPIVATLPVAWLLHAAMLPPPGEEGTTGARRAARRLAAAAPLLALSVAAAVRDIGAASGALHAGFRVPGLPPTAYAATQLRVVPTYLRLLAWPVGQCADWPFPASRSFLEPAVLAGALFLGGLVLAAVFLVVRLRDVPGDPAAAARASAFGALFFLVALAPSSSLVPLLDPLAEHRVYLAALGPFLAVAAVGAALLRRLAPSRALLAGCALTLAAGAAAGLATARRAAVWTTPVAFWTDTAEKAPQKARVLQGLGDALLEANRTAEALEAFRRARVRASDHTVVMGAVLQSLVSTLTALGRTDEARAELDATLRRSPRDATALALLASVEFVSGRDAECERAANAALELDPRNVDALKYLGMSRLRVGDVLGAGDALRRAAATHVIDPMVHWQLGEAEERTGNLPAACAAYARGAAQPGNPSVAALAARAGARIGCR
jgi:tetratricopeptide (TPR) repeat protein